MGNFSDLSIARCRLILTLQVWLLFEFRKNGSGDYDLLNLGCTFVKRDDPCISVHPLNRVVLHVAVAAMDLDGYAVGGLAVGETAEQMYHILDVTVPHLPQNRLLRYHDIR